MDKLLLYNCSQIVTPKGSHIKKGKEMDQVEVMQNASIYMEDGIILFLGANEEVLHRLGAAYIEQIPGDIMVIDGAGRTALPGFVDSHTHFIFGGYREVEFMERLSGASYLDIMRKGGGIQSTVNATRSYGEDRLFADGRNRLHDMLSQGVTTVEGKSGYGLDLACEEKQLRVMKELNKVHPVEIVSTYLGAHAVPLEYKNDPAGYVTYMVEVVMPKVKEKNLAEFCDVFCEEEAFDTEQSRFLLTEAKKMGFEIKIHADEIYDLGGGRLAAELGAASADHLLMISEESMAALAESETVASVLPCTAFCLNKPFAPAKKMIESGCGLALATDFNPGSSFTNSIPLMLSLAVLKMGMTLPQALTALTLNGAAALKRADKIGTLEAGKQGDIVLLEYPDYRFLIYHTAKNIVHSVIKNGHLVYKKEES
ncbi:imidazolonepropionase [Lacrimispora sp.]|uniref:imidazolonepropionase n=1 Tax=Lacrimispora sp. TaxID=2719234 RepID=UPI0039937A64